MPATATDMVLDSFALIGYLENEPFATHIEKMLKQARQGEMRIYLHAIHLGEVYYIALREQGPDLADLAYARIKAFPLIYVDTIHEQLLRRAANFKAHYPISYADAFAAAMAVIYSATLLTGDPEFKKLEKKEAFAIKWLT